MDPNRRASLGMGGMPQSTFQLHRQQQQQQQQQQQHQQQQLLMQQQLQHQFQQQQQYHQRTQQLQQQQQPPMMYPIPQQQPSLPQSPHNAPHNLYGNMNGNITPISPPTGVQMNPMSGAMNSALGHNMVPVQNMVPATMASSPASPSVPLQSNAPKLLPFSERVDMMIQRTIQRETPFNVEVDGVPLLTQEEYTKHAKDIQRLVSDNTIWQLPSTPKDPLLWNTAQLLSNLFRDAVMARRNDGSTEQRARAFQGVQDKMHSKTFFKAITKVFIDNAVNGDGLLRHVTKEELKDGLGISTWNWRNMLWDWVEALRDSSPKYQEWVVQDRRRTLANEQRLQNLVHQKVDDAKDVLLIESAPASHSLARRTAAPPVPLFTEGFQPLRYEEFREAPPRVLYTFPGRQKKLRLDSQADAQLEERAVTTRQAETTPILSEARNSPKEVEGDNAQKQGHGNTEDAVFQIPEISPKKVEGVLAPKEKENESASETPVEKRLDAMNGQHQNVPETANGFDDRLPDAGEENAAADTSMSKQTLEPQQEPPKLLGSIRDLRADDWPMFQLTEDDKPTSPHADNLEVEDHNFDKFLNAMNGDMSTLSGEILERHMSIEKNEEGTANSKTDGEKEGSDQGTSKTAEEPQKLVDSEKPVDSKEPVESAKPAEPEKPEEEMPSASEKSHEDNPEEEEISTQKRQNSCPEPRPTSPKSIRSSPTIVPECEKTGEDVVMDEAPALTPPKSPTLGDETKQEKDHIQHCEPTFVEDGKKADPEHKEPSPVENENSNDDSMDMDISYSEEQKAVAEQLEMELSNAEVDNSVFNQKPPSLAAVEGTETFEKDGEGEEPEKEEVKDKIAVPEISKPVDALQGADGAPEASVPMVAASNADDGGSEELRAFKEETASPGPNTPGSGHLSGGNEAKPIVIDDSDDEDQEEDQLVELKARQVKKEFLTTFEGSEAEINSKDFEKAKFLVKYKSDKNDYFTLPISLSKVHRDQAHVFSNPDDGWWTFQQKVTENFPKAMKQRCIDYTIVFRIPYNSEDRESWHDVLVKPGEGMKWLSVVRAVLVLHLRECKVVVKGTPMLTLDDDGIVSAVKAKDTSTKRLNTVLETPRRMSVQGQQVSSRGIMQNGQYTDSYFPRKRVLACEILYSELGKNRRATDTFSLAPAVFAVKGMSMKDRCPGNQRFRWKCLQRLLYNPDVDSPAGRGRNGRYKKNPRFSKDNHAKILERYLAEEEEEKDLGDDSQPVQTLAEMIASRQDNFDIDQLEKWNNMEDDKEFPVFGESGDEGEYDEETMKEIEREELRAAGAKPVMEKKLSPEEIRVVIQDVIRRYQTLWATEKKPQLEKQVLKIWKEGRDPYKRTRAKNELASQIAALEKTAKEFENVEYSSEDELKSKTGNLQNLVNYVERMRWIIEVHGLASAPSKKAAAAPVKGLEDESSEAIDETKSLRTRSKSRIAGTDESEDDSFDDFIVDDDDNVAIDADIADEFMPGMKAAGCTLEALANQQSWTQNGPDKDLRDYLKTVDRESLYDGVLSCLYDHDNCTSDDIFRDSLIAVYLAKNFQLSDPNMIEFPVPQHLVDDILGLGQPGFFYYLEDCDKFMEDHFKKKEERRRRKRAQLSSGRRTRVPIDSDDEDYDSSDDSQNGSKLTGSGEEVDGTEGPMDQFVRGGSKARGKGKAKGSQKDSNVKKPKERKEIKEDAGAAAQRRKHANLVDDWEARRKEAQARQATQLAQNTGKKIMINQGHPDDEEDIFIHPYFSNIIKDHQAEGVQFLWREIVGVKLCKGALLSHTMGLGKTFQVIVLLFTLASALTNEKIKATIPEVLHNRRFMVLCPPALLVNWFEEIERRVPKDEMEIVGPILTLTAGQGKTLKKALLEKEEEVKHWFKHGGVILMGYEAFKTVVLNKPPKSGVRKNLFNEDEHKRWKEYLINPGPSLVVADEAHNLKNSKTDVANAAALFKTTSRIAMTGSPLSNNLEEYYSMIDWIHPGYLGPIKEFRTNYVSFIQDGMYAESTQSERSKARVKLETLSKLLEKKCHRRDITALASDLPPKTEFVIMIPLTNVQKELYNWYLSRKRSDSQFRALGALKRLQMILNHPAILIRKLRVVKNTLKGLSEVIDEVEDEEDDADIGEDGKFSAASKKMAEDALEFLKTVTPEGFDLEAVKNSHRMVLLIEILKKSQKMGDKVLVFSHQISTINYVKEQLDKHKISNSVLTGSTIMSSRQNAINDFNSRTNKITVFLMSTKAGGIGLNITGANRIVILDTEFNPTWDEQAVGRAYRLLQKKPVFVYRFQSVGTFEVALNAQGTFKLQLQDKVIDKRNWTTRAGRDGMRQYMIQASIPEKPTAEIPEEITLKDVILSGLCRDTKEIYGVVHTETFKVDVKEDLSAEELQEVQKAVELEELRVNDPEEWRKRVHYLDPADEARRFKEESRRQALHSGSLPEPTQQASRQQLPPQIPVRMQNPSNATVKGPHPTSSQNSALSERVAAASAASRNPSSSSTKTIIHPSNTVSSTKTVITPASNLQNARATPSTVRTFTPSSSRSNPLTSTPAAARIASKSGSSGVSAIERDRMVAAKKLLDKKRSSNPDAPRTTRSSVAPNSSAANTQVPVRNRPSDSVGNSGSMSSKKSRH